MADDPEEPINPFPALTEGSPFPPLEGAFPAEAPLEPEPASDWIETADAHDLAVPQQDWGRENALVALGRFAFPPPPPLDDEGVAARDQRWTTRAILTAAVFLLVFNAVSIQNWSRQKAPGWVTTTVQQLSDVWATQLAQLAANQPREGVREAYEGAKAARYPGEAAE